MIDMIEKVARAIWAERRRYALTQGIYLEDYDEGLPHFGAVACNIEAEARAAIEAMRAPTDEMVEAASSEYGSALQSSYHTMIDAALNVD